MKPSENNQQITNENNEISICIYRIEEEMKFSWK